MRRPDKYPETPYFVYYNRNPRNRITGDCAFRAISLGLEMDYNTTVMEMAENMCKTGYAMNDSKGESSYLEYKGWIKNKQLKHEDGTKYTGKQFSNWLSVNFPKAEIGNVVCHIGGHHIVCFKPIKEGDVYRYKCHDIWDSTDGCIGNWWVKSYRYVKES